MIVSGSICEWFPGRFPSCPMVAVVLAAGRSAVRRPFQLGQEHADRGAVVGALRPRPGNYPVRTDHEVTAQLQAVAAEPLQPLPTEQQAGIAPPHSRVQPDGSERRPRQSPGAIGDPVQVDEHRPGKVEAAEQPGAHPLRGVVDHEHHRTAGPFDTVAVVEHLHEVRAADQSASVAQKRHQHRGTAERCQIKPAAA
jgi:hypothetical protein